MLSPWAACLGAALLLVAGLASLPDVSGASTTKKRSFYAGASELVPASSFTGARMAEWDFSKLPDGWTTQDDVTAKPTR